jgi:hypothetical protein
LEATQVTIRRFAIVDEPEWHSLVSQLMQNSQFARRRRSVIQPHHRNFAVPVIDEKERETG